MSQKFEFLSKAIVISFLSYSPEAFLIKGFGKEEEESQFEHDEVLDERYERNRFRVTMTVVNDSLPSNFPLEIR